MTTLGLVFLPQLAPERLRAVSQAADEAGLEELWLWEDCFFESGVASAAAALAWTNRAGVGIGLLPVPLRNVALAAMEIATMQRLFPGRVRVAVGHGVQSWMGQVGARAASPLSLLREHLSALRCLLDGQEVTTTGQYVRLDGVRLEWPPLAPPELLAGASGPRSLRLSGELADGTVLTGGTSPDGVRRARGLIEQGRAVSGRDGRHDMVVYLLAATGPGAEDRLLREYQKWGFGPGERVGVAGDADEVARAIGEFVRAGAGTVVLQPTADEPDMAGFARFVARQVRPLVR
ncbi:MAG TPA: LLM class flavin-dependent oxidoreductase [Acidimicrobiales bacterium]|nr:LLM class flavin-dependent oxidoreductase [Acidimicrobiales bacterium]